jgi:hypothetical protein
MCSKRKFRQPYKAELKRLSKKLLVAKNKAQETFLRSVLENEGRCWTGFYKYVKRRKGNRENIPETKDHNDKLITEPIVNSYFASQFSYKRNNPQITSTESGKHFTICINNIRKRLPAIGRKKSVGRDGIPGELLN